MYNLTEVAPSEANRFMASFMKSNLNWIMSSASGQDFVTYYALIPGGMLITVMSNSHLPAAPGGLSGYVRTPAIQFIPTPSNFQPWIAETAILRLCESFNIRDALELNPMDLFTKLQKEIEKICSYRYSISSSEFALAKLAVATITAKLGEPVTNHYFQNFHDTKQCKEIIETYIQADNLDNRFVEQLRDALFKNERKVAEFIDTAAFTLNNINTQYARMCNEDKRLQDRLDVANSKSAGLAYIAGFMWNLVKDIENTRKLLRKDEEEGIAAFFDISRNIINFLGTISKKTEELYGPDWQEKLAQITAIEDDIPVPVESENAQENP